MPNMQTVKPPVDPGKKRSFLIYLGLIVITLFVFLQVYSFEFINYDDDIYVYKNPHIQAGITLESVKWAFSTGYANFWHPLTWLSHMLDWELFGARPAGYHLMALFFHIANTLLLFIVLKRMTEAPWRSAFVAALFALHPLHVESVAWVTERKDVLSTFFWLLTMWAYVRYVNRPGAANYLMVVLFFVLGMMAKPMLVTLPFVLMLLDYWPLNRFLNSKFSILNSIIEKIPLFVLSAVSSVVAFIAQRAGEAVASTAMLPVRPRIINALISYVIYIEKMFWPSRLAVFYPYPISKLTVWSAAAPLLLLLAISVIVFLLAKRHRYLVTGWLWYLGTLVPVIGLVQVGSYARADRFTYITLTGLFIIVAWGAPDLLAKFRYKRILLTVSGLLIISTLSVCTWFQLRHWRNNETLFRHALQVTQSNYVAHRNLADVLFEQSRFSEAEEQCKKYISIVPDDPKVINTLAAALSHQGRLDEAAEYFTQALRIAPDDISIRLNLGLTLIDSGRFQEAAKEYGEVLLLDPNNAAAHNGIGIALLRQGRVDEAVQYFTEALRIKPDFAGAHNNLGCTLGLQGKLDEAVVHFDEALRLDPNYAAAHYELGRVLARMGKINQAIGHAEAAVRLKPDWDEALNVLAWYFAVNKDTEIYNPDEAVKLALRACELTDNQRPDFLDTLAVAYAAKGDFGKAVQTTEQALALCRSAQQEQLRKELESRLLLFRAGKPYVESR
jgi:tetratricopeptide (TPR) repeat protein